MARLDNKVAFITGGESGIGLATARLFAAEGAQVHLAGLHAGRLAEAVAELGPDVAACSVTDVTDEGQVIAAVAHAVDALEEQPRLVFAAEILAEQAWPRLYDADQLARNEVPVAATIYVNDLYVERRFAEEMAVAIRRLRPWVTDEYEHNGLRADGERVLGRLIDLARGRA